MKYLPALFLALLPVCGASAQSGDFMILKDKKCNIGIRVGFDASLPIVRSLTSDGTPLDSYSQQYKVGYLAAVSLRVGKKRFFFNPSVSWHREESELQFALPHSFTPEEMEQSETALLNSLHIKTSAIEMPLLVGYDLVKENPYRLSVLAGPVLKYRYKANYNLSIPDATSSDFMEDNHPYGLGILAGINVTIGRLFLDFNYEFGIIHTSSTFQYTLAGSQPSALEYERRSNSISFALGFLF